MKEGNHPDGMQYDWKKKFAATTIPNDENRVVKHEACYQIGARNMQKNIPALDADLHDKSVLTKHEALESLG